MAQWATSLKMRLPEEIVAAIQAAHAGKMYLSLDLGNTAFKVEKSSEALPAITRREKEILQLISEGLTNNVIAKQLFISELTVDTHKKNLLTKFDVNNTAALIKIAMRHNLLKY